MGKCVLCGANATASVQENASRIIYNCQSCGVFVLSDLSATAAKRHCCELAAFFAARKLAGCNETVLISFDKAKKDKDYIQLTVEQILDLHPKIFEKKLDMILKNLAFMSAYEGAEIKVESLDMGPVFYLRQNNYDALSFIIKSLQAMQLVEVNYYGGSFFPCGIIISPKGWERISGLESGSTPSVKTALIVAGKTEQGAAFRAMARKAAKECGFDVAEMNIAEARDSVSLETIAMLKSGGFAITDITGASAISYFAAGMTMALGKVNILACHNSARSKLMLDTEQISVLGWDSEDELYLQLLNAIRAHVQ